MKLDYLLLEQGEIVFMSSAVEHSSLESTPLVQGRIVAIVPEGHEHDQSVHPHDGVSELLAGMLRGLTQP